MRVREIFARDLFIVVFGITVSALAAGGFIGIRYATAKYKNDLYGSAHWALEEEVRATGLLDRNDGVYVGCVGRPR
jgi:type IV secretory pathway TraG/TraD family ATPase VirD4